MKPKSKGKRNFVIPALLNAGNGEMVPWEKYPEAMVWGDDNLAEILGTSRSTIHDWKKKGRIPFRQAPGYAEYKLLDVIKALREFGYGQDVEGNPTGHNC